MSIRICISDRKKDIEFRDKSSEIQFDQESDRSFYNVFSLFDPGNINFQISVIAFVLNSFLFNPIDNGFDVFVN